MPVQLNGADLITSFGDYEQGTFTPQIADNNLDGSGEGQGYSVQVGEYTKIGNRVFIQLRLTTTSLGCLAGNEGVRILGLPFVTNSKTNNFPSFTVGSMGALNITAGYDAGVFANTNVAYLSLNLNDGAAGHSIFTITEFSADGFISIAGQYQV